MRVTPRVRSLLGFSPQILSALLFAAPAAQSQELATPTALWPIRPPLPEVWRGALPKKASREAVALSEAIRLLAEDKTERARSRLRPLRSHPQFGDHALGIEAKALLTEARLQFRKSPSLAEARARQAIENFDRIRSEHPLSPWYSKSDSGKAQAELWRGAALEKLKRRRESQSLLERGFQRLLLENTPFLIRPEALEAYAGLCSKKNKPRSCGSWILRLAGVFPRTSTEGKLLLEKFPGLLEPPPPNFTAAKLAQTYKQRDADESAFDGCFTLVLSDKKKEARKCLEKVLEDFPRSSQRHRFRYWLGRVVEQDRDLNAAIPLFEQVLRESPLTLHGLLASWRLNRDPLLRFSALTPELSLQDSFQSPQEFLRMERVKDLIAAGADELAAMDLKELKPRSTASGKYLLHMASLSHLAGAHLAAFGNLTELIQRGDESVYSTDVLNLVFPQVAESLIQKQAEKSGVAPLLVLSLIKQESGFEREIHSSAGASGYMQIIHPTASEVEPGIRRDDLLDPETNLRVGTRYLKRMLTRYNGNVALALAAYNAGPGATDRWIKEGRADRGFLEFVERIPYRETREYVGTIFRNFTFYSRRLENRIITTTDPFWTGPVTNQP